MKVSVVSRDKILVLGSGWAGYKILATFKDPGGAHTLTCVSERNHFLFTPLLSTTCVGTLEFRGICEPTMNLRHVSFIHAEAVSVDPRRKVVLCRSVHDVARNDDDNSERFYPEFEVAYDKL
jgi:NADH dehydrogenase FAD-containing subunit